jgi:hypothetical protein
MSVLTNAVALLVYKVNTFADFTTALCNDFYSDYSAHIIRNIEHYVVQHNNLILHYVLFMICVAVYMYNTNNQITELQHKLKTIYDNLKEDDDYDIDAISDVDYYEQKLQLFKNSLSKDIKKLDSKLNTLKHTLRDDFSKVNTKIQTLQKNNTAPPCVKSRVSKKDYKAIQKAINGLNISKPCTGMPPSASK